MSTECKDWLADLSDEQKRNYELCMKYPILIPHSCWTGEVAKDYMYEFTKLDSIPTGWRIAFGEQWAAEVQEAVNKMPKEKQDKIMIMDLKEKYGSFRQDFNYYTKELVEVIDKYEKLSRRICIRCGTPATKISLGWISPYCDVCSEKIPYKKIDIDKWFEEVK